MWDITVASCLTFLDHIALWIVVALHLRYLCRHLSSVLRLASRSWKKDRPEMWETHASHVLTLLLKGTLKPEHCSRFLATAL